MDTTAFRHDDSAGDTHAALRFLTAGSVDDGKSTLIGRLLYDSRALLTDQVDALRRHSRGEALDLSLLTDGLEAEREQGITIDVAYRYFATPRRKFIIADAPGHEQYTRNMVTAAAGSHAAVVLVDVTKLDLTQRPVTLLPQTRRHALLVQRLGVPHIIFAVNKIDAVPDAAAAFAATREALLTFADRAGLHPAGIVPVSALRGDNVTTPAAIGDYRGPTLLALLESLPVLQPDADAPWRLSVQWVARQGDGTGHQPRIFWGRLGAGTVRVGDEVVVHPSGERARVAAVLHHGAQPIEAGHAGQSIGLVLDRQLDISRGDWLGAPGSLSARSSFGATLAWLDTEAAVVGRRYWLRHGHRWVQGRISAIEHRLDIDTLAPTPAQQLGVNDIGRVQIQCAEALPVSRFHGEPMSGALILVDPGTHRTSGALLVD
ncbi:sulfate adenylyltransferase [Tepidimonas taiwanensis]|uniref:sulfate adenylyltransferase n=1 Tax=Tepidimonas taiwanensis TaxID=307486 RepID=A0A554XAG7_9BURK|nr:GTP-binding protein [Tepidimonas taiwanensis]MCX7692874.1 GTP-binding protein [Tepidimonas taiwanensis]MDM7464496.1 GTP-binding protein [Tepidimonas taiwanensis]TSE32830.1 Sulfate adenylyltransferase subunit 1 [Tepidimonas taiwanensis]UBQ05652.1 sulfate adenylyltransferase [Tepidimonas taiwanensis]